MRFGRKSRRRHSKGGEPHPGDQSSALATDDVQQDDAQQNEDSVLEEDSQIVEDTETVIQLDTGEADTKPVSSATVDAPEGTPTQILLTALGRFQREVKTVEDGKGADGWTDICMNQLIVSTEVALTESWSDVFDALTGTGRILQSYENNKQSEKSLPFLNKSYEVLCLMAGDLIVGSVRQGVREQWNDLFRKQMEFMEGNGIVLIQDEDELNERDDSSPVVEETKDPVEQDLEELSTLDELPPLTELLNKEHSSPVEELEDFQDERDDVTVADPSEGLELFNTDTKPAAVDSETVVGNGFETEVEVEENLSSGEPETLRFEPPKRVVEIIDRLCEQLRSLPELKGDPKTIALETFMGGLTALQRDAEDHQHEIAAQLSATMLDATEHTAKWPDQITDDFSDLGFGFCGVFIEALNEGLTENTMEWDAECREWAAKMQELVEKAPEQDTDDVVESESNIQTAGAPEDLEFEPLEPTIVEEKEEPEANPVQAIKAANVIIPAPEGDDESQALLNAAQNAALQGDAEGAKNFALKAAEVIAKMEVKNATKVLLDAEERLKETLHESESSKKSVKEEEKNVKSAAKQVSDSEKNTLAIQADLDEQSEQMTVLQKELEKFNQKIETLQKKQEDQVAKIHAAEDQFQQTQRNKETAEETTSRGRSAENERRAELESKRQLVKESQRNAKEIETEIASHRAKLEQEEKSHDDIAQTIDLLGKPQRQEEKESDDNGLLF